MSRNHAKFRTTIAVIMRKWKQGFDTSRCSIYRPSIYSRYTGPEAVGMHAHKHMHEHAKT